MNQRHRTTHRRGFTLLEILVVISVILILAGLAISFGIGVMASGQVEKTKADMSILMTALGSYYNAQDEGYPAGDNDGELFTQLRAFQDSALVLEELKPETYEGNIFRDAFGEPLDYERSGGLGGKSPLLTSPGPDGVMNLGTPSDSTNDDNITSAQ